MSVDTHSEDLRVAEEFEDSIKKASDSNENQDEGHSNTDEEVNCPANTEQKILTYQDRKRKKGRENRYKDIIACLR